MRRVAENINAHQQAAKSHAQSGAEAKDIQAFKDALIEDLGGADAISTQQATLVELAARRMVLLHVVDSWLFEDTRLRTLNRRDKKLHQVTIDRGRIEDGLVRILDKLGLDKHVPKGRDLSDWLADRDEDEADYTVDE